MSGQRVRCADSSAGLTTRSHTISKEAGTFEGRGGYKVLMSFQARHSHKERTRSCFLSPWPMPWRRLLWKLVMIFRKDHKCYKWERFCCLQEIWDFTHHLKYWIIFVVFALTHAGFHLPNKLPKSSFQTFSSDILPVSVGWCYHVVIKR